MARRSTSRSKVDDATFPIRVRLVVPETGFGTRIDVMLAWLRALPDDFYAWHSGGSGGSAWAVRDAVYVYFRSIDHAHGFVHAFPELELCDDVPA